MITIVDYNAGNLRSVQRACDAVGIESVFTQDADAVAKADKIIFPGVGHARAAMETLVRTGLADAVSYAYARGTPILGICVGAQLVLDSSEEGETLGLGFIAGRTKLFRIEDPALKIPHMGWNAVQVERRHPLLEPFKTGDEPYFVHSYYLAPSTDEHVYATTEHGSRFCVALGKDNLFATQFHPEKSGRVGLSLLSRFATWDGGPC